MSDENVIKMISKDINELAPRILKVAQSRGIKQMAGLIQACLEEDEVEEEALTDGRNQSYILSSFVLSHFINIII